MKYQTDEAVHEERLPGSAPRELAVIADLMSSAQILSSQVRSPTTWSPEKFLAGSVLASALVEIRDHHWNPVYRHRVSEDLRWIRSDDTDWPFSFRRLCELFELDPQWVREVVQQWLGAGRRQSRSGTPPRKVAA